MRRAQAILLATFLTAAAGCGGGPKFAPVSGRVTMNGKPVAGVVVSFQPISESKSDDPGPGSVGITDGDGKFTLHSQLDKGQAGAVTAKHRVRISPAGEGPAGDADAADPKKKKATGPSVPEEYNNKSNLEFNVPAGGSDQANFDLKPAPPTPKGGVPKGAIDS